MTLAEGSMNAVIRALDQAHATFEFYVQGRDDDSEGHEDEHRGKGDQYRITAHYGTTAIKSYRTGWCPTPAIALVEMQHILEAAR
jgi:hypothetical protein